MNELGIVDFQLILPNLANKNTEYCVKYKFQINNKYCFQYEYVENGCMDTGVGKEGWD